MIACIREAFAHIFLTEKNKNKNDIGVGLEVKRISPRFFINKGLLPGLHTLSHNETIVRKDFREETTQRPLNVPQRSICYKITWFNGYQL